ncbi:MAG: Methyltransf 11 protein [Magnetococcales bacterium]|nr:Methyltransf 11 protein [Magnetococcales bacterium]HIJ83423.1 methyltransferase domain-containing protein [Magnetococcales bacterium]
MRQIPIQPIVSPVAEMAIPQANAMDFVRVRRAWRRLGERGSGAFADTLLHRVGELLALRLDEIRIQPDILLDLGCRNGSLRDQLTQSAKKKRQVISVTFAESCARRIVGARGKMQFFIKKPAILCAQPTFLPFPGDSFDAVVSNMALHWIGDRRGALREIRRVLKPGGVLLFTISGATTLMELRGCLAELDQRRWRRVWPRIPVFPSLHELGDELLILGFRLPVVDREVIHPTFANTKVLLQHLQSLGGCNPHTDRVSTLTGKGYFADLQQLYQSQHALSTGLLPVTVEILFGHGWRS